MSSGPDGESDRKGEQPTTSAQSPANRPPYPIERIPTDAGPVPPQGVSREEHQQTLGTFLALIVGLSILGLLILVAILAFQKRDPQYIGDVVGTLSPFILPALGALVGYAFAERKQNGGS